jgi:hypothetical protein
MATWYLLNNVSAGTSVYYAGSLIDDTLEDTTQLLSAGGVLIDSSLPGMSAAADLAQNAKNRGAGIEKMESIMMAAYQHTEVEVADSRYVIGGL